MPMRGGVRAGAGARGGGGGKARGGNPDCGRYRFRAFGQAAGDAAGGRKTVRNGGGAHEPEGALCDRAIRANPDGCDACGGGTANRFRRGEEYFQQRVDDRRFEGAANGSERAGGAANAAGRGVPRRHAGRWTEAAQRFTAGRGAISGARRIRARAAQGHATDGRECADHAGAAGAHRGDHGGESQLAFGQGALEPIEAEDEAGGDVGAAHEGQRPAAKEICGRRVSWRDRGSQARRVRCGGEPASADARSDRRTSGARASDRRALQQTKAAETAADLSGRSGGRGFAARRVAEHSR